MLYVIEGCDGSGKSTLARRLATQLPGSTEVRHCGPPKEHVLVEYERNLDSYRVNTTNKHVIYDRHYLGELIYGPLYRERSMLSAAARLHIEMYLSSRGAVLVLLTNAAEVLRDRCKRDGEDFLKLEDVEGVVAAFRRAYASASVERKLILEDPDKNEVDMLVQYGARAAEEAKHLEPFRTYVGHPEPDVLLLGEQRAENYPGHDACFVPYSHTSGAYLLSALLGGRLSLDRLGIANALEEDVPTVVSVLGDPVVVTLGKRAHRHLEDLGVPHGAVPHPQFVRMFHHAKMREYADVLTDVARSGGDLSGWPDR